jgi:hypothetical protein
MENSGMHNGRMGRKIDKITTERAQQLFKKGLAPKVVASRLGISESMARNIPREMPMPQEMPAETSDWINKGSNAMRSS